MARMTIRDIARLAGVSVTTVSRALNNAPEINSQTRERVLQVCREQGYRSNLLARSLVSSRTRVLGVILPELSGPFHASIVLHLERYAQEQDYQIMLCCGRVGGSETAALFDFLVSHRVDGILLVSASSAAPDLLRRHARGTPSVLLGDVSPTATLQRINAVSTDNYVGGAMAAGYLSRLGHRRVLYLGPRRDSVTHVLRHQGFLTIARERGMEVETVFNPGAVSSARYPLSQRFIHDFLSRRIVVRHAENHHIPLFHQHRVVQLGHFGGNIILKGGFLILQPLLNRLVQPFGRLLIPGLEHGDFLRRGAGAGIQLSLGHIGAVYGVQRVSDRVLRRRHLVLEGQAVFQLIRQGGRVHLFFPTAAACQSQQKKSQQQHRA